MLALINLRGALLSGAAVLVLLTGCAPPIPDGGFNAPDPASRLYAAAQVAANWSSIQPPEDRKRPPIATLQQLVVMLESSDPAERLVLDRDRGKLRHDLAPPHHALDRRWPL